MMSTEKLNELRDIVLKILVNHLRINKSANEKVIIKDMLEKIDNHNILKNLALIVHFNPPKKQKFSFEEFLYLFIVIIKKTNESEYANYKTKDLIEKIFEDPLLNCFIHDSINNEAFKKFFLILKI